MDTRLFIPVTYQSEDTLDLIFSTSTQPQIRPTVYFHVLFRQRRRKLLRPETEDPSVRVPLSRVDPPLRTRLLCARPGWDNAHADTAGACDWCVCAGLRQLIGRHGCQSRLCPGAWITCCLSHVSLCVISLLSCKGCLKGGGLNIRHLRCFF